MTKESLHLKCSMCEHEEDIILTDKELSIAPLAVAKEIIAHNRDWRILWVTGNKLVCPACIKKLARAFVPGVGIELVPKIMVNKGQAYLLEDIVGK